MKIIPRPIIFGVILAVELLIVYSAAIYNMHGFSKPPVRDEVHFWPTAQLFSQPGQPSLTLIKNYPELNTPLPFMVFGFIEKFAGNGLLLGRMLNLLASLSIIFFLLTFSAWDMERSFKVVTGLLLFPYFIGCAVHFYTDMLPCLFVVMAMAAYRRGLAVATGLLFILAVASRQYMIVFPLGIIVWESAKVFARNRHFPWSFSCERNPLNYPGNKSMPMIIMNAVSCLSLCGWFLLWGGFAPVAEMARQQSRTGTWHALPHNALYGLAVLGAYYVIPEAIMFFRKDRKYLPPLKPILIIGMVLAGLFCVWPPTGNPFGIFEMGFLDQAIRRIAGNGFPRMLILWGLAMLAAVRFRHWRLTSIFALITLMMLIKSHIAWDKYLLVLIAVLWLNKAAEDKTTAEPELKTGQ